MKDPLSDNEMHRVCHPCATSTTRKESGADTAFGAAKRHCPEGARSTMKRVDTTALRKAHGADNRERLTFVQQREALDLLKTMTGVSSCREDEDRVEHPLLVEEEANSLHSDGDEANSSAGDNNQSTQPVRLPRPPPYTDVAGHFGGLEGAAERCRMSEVSYHLCKAKLAWTGEVESRKTKQICIADFVYCC